jgi:hypothetical protein
MGLEFVRKAAPSYRKGLDRKRIELATPNLFTQNPICAPRAYAASLRTGVMLTAGEKLGIRLDDRQVVALRGLSPVAIFSAPSAELMEALKASYGEAYGVVQVVHDIAHMAEITVC